MSRLMAGALAAVLTLTAPFAGMSAVTSGAQLETEQTLPTGGAGGIVTEQIVRVLSDGTGGGSMLRSIRPELSRYDYWDCYSNDYYYSKLSAKEQLLYEDLDAACGELLQSSDLDAASYEVNSAGKLVRRYGTKRVSCRGLSSEQVQKVQSLFIYANPQYYFLNTIGLTGKDTCVLGVYDAFADGSSRAQATQSVQARLEKLQAQISDDGIPYVTEAQIHELLCNKLTYMVGDDLFSAPDDPYFTQNIYGALMNGETVCAGYTKLYSALCNYFGIDCISVTSATHSWNEVRYGDHWYIVDVTWDDSWDRGKYYHLSDQQMAALDRTNEHVPSSACASIRPVADTEFSSELMLLTGLAQPKVEIRDTAAGVTITMTSDEGEIYYTLDGTIPGESDLYTGPIELTDGGTYIVTATTAREGAVSSAYEIFPVRIAGGRVSVASVMNLPGKNVRVKFNAKRDYDGYQISYALKKDFSKQKTTLLDSSTVKSKMVDISDLKKGKTYYIRVRGYKKDAYGNYYYTPYSKIKKVTVTK